GALPAAFSGSLQRDARRAQRAAALRERAADARGVPVAHRPRRRAAGRLAIDRHRPASGPRLWLAGADRRRDARRRQRPGVHDLQRSELPPHRAHHARHGPHRRALARARLLPAASVGGSDHRSLGPDPAMKTGARGALPFAVLIAVWWLVTRRGFVQPIFLPPPGDVVRVATELASDGSLWINIAASLGRVFLGIVAGVPLAVGLGVLVALNRRLAPVVEPLVG